MRNLELFKYLSATMKWANENGINFKGVIEEVSLAGFSNEEVGMMIKEICLNDSFKINKK